MINLNSWHCMWNVTNHRYVMQNISNENEYIANISLITSDRTLQWVLTRLWSHYFFHPWFLCLQCVKPENKNGWYGKRPRGTAFMSWGGFQIAKRIVRMLSHWSKDSWNCLVSKLVWKYWVLRLNCGAKVQSLKSFKMKGGSKRLVSRLEGFTMSNRSNYVGFFGSRLKDVTCFKPLSTSPDIICRVLVFVFWRFWLITPAAPGFPTRTIYLRTLA